MKIILNKDVQNLGEEGDVKDVAPGYARNYLIPKGLGVSYSKQNLALLEGKRTAIEKRKEEKKERAAGLKERIESLSLQITMTVGENGRLFGSVTNAMISDELAKLGIEIERKKVEIAEHTIKTTGTSVVKVKLYGNETASLKVTVAGPAGPAKPATEAPSKSEPETSGEAVEAAPAVEAAAEAEDTAETEAAPTEEPAVAEPEAATSTADEAEPDTAEAEAGGQTQEEEVAAEPDAEAVDEESTDRE